MTRGYSYTQRDLATEEFFEGFTFLISAHFSRLARHPPYEVIATNDQCSRVVDGCITTLEPTAIPKPGTPIWAAAKVGNKEVVL